MPGSPAWWDTGSAQVLSDFRRDVWTRDNIVRARFRALAVACMLLAVAILASLSFINEPALRSGTYSYRVTKPNSVPSGGRIVTASCPCSKESLLWSEFVKWPRFAANQGLQDINTYCSQLLEQAAGPRQTPTSSPALPPGDSIGWPAELPPDGPDATVPPSIAEDPAATVPPAASPPDDPAATVPPAASPPDDPAGTVQPAAPPPDDPAATVPPAESPPDDPLAAVPPTSAPGRGRRLHQGAKNATSAAATARNTLVLKVCLAWVQDITTTIERTNLAYTTEAYQGGQLRTAGAVKNISRLWLGGKLDYHLQLEYRVAILTWDQPELLPVTFRAFLADAKAQVQRMFVSVASEIADNLSYESYKKLCGTTYCDVVATKPAYLYAIDGIAKFGGLWSNVMLVTMIMWFLATRAIPVLREPTAAYSEFT